MQHDQHLPSSRRMATRIHCRIFPWSRTVRYHSWRMSILQHVFRSWAAMSIWVLLIQVWVLQVSAGCLFLIYLGLSVLLLVHCCCYHCCCYHCCSHHCWKLGILWWIVARKRKHQQISFDESRKPQLLVNWGIKEPRDWLLWDSFSIIIFQLCFVVRLLAVLWSLFLVPCPWVLGCELWVVSWQYISAVYTARSRSLGFFSQLFRKLRWYDVIDINSYDRCDSTSHLPISIYSLLPMKQSFRTNWIFKLKYGNCIWWKALDWVPTKQLYNPTARRIE